MERINIPKADTFGERDGGEMPSLDRLLLENTGCWATRDEENEAIHVFAKDGSELYAVSAKVIPYESKPLFLTLQIYLAGYNNGRVTALGETKVKIDKITELIKLCV